ncbi:chaperonin CPN60-like 2, mitochondrial [Pistacia vera]|uniref:chaperonin CPN60-like 2, mitochondrial n=1 Tax=Pistacia vera TaxID=55513 RepID=UPI0012630619|nr:chaperonin CPN60-like 2, mitochondrial [Pistacia vera]
MKGTLNHGLLFTKKEHFLLEAYADANWATDVNDRRSTSGYAMFIGGNLVQWSSKKQEVVSLSSTEAEYRALSQASTELVGSGIYLKKLELPAGGNLIYAGTSVSAITISDFSSTGIIETGLGSVLASTMKESTTKEASTDASEDTFKVAILTVSDTVVSGTEPNRRKVATISANGELEIGELIARAIEKVGKEGVITVVDGNTLDNELEVVEGMKLGRGYISPYSITNQKTQKCELENPYILIHDKKISDMNSPVRILELALNKNRELLAVAADVESDALATFILNKNHAGVKVCAVKAPGFGENIQANLDDLAILTGGEVIFEDHGLTLDKVKVEMFGTARKVTVSVDDTIILHGGGDMKLIE